MVRCLFVPGEPRRYPANGMKHKEHTLDEFFKHPSLYCGGVSLDAVLTFLSGYDFAIERHELPANNDPFLLPFSQLKDWVAYRLHFSNSTRGIEAMITSKTSSDRAAIDMFQQLLHAFQSRKPTVVAKLASHKQTVTKRNANGALLETRFDKPFPQTILLITYTDDPGFFAYGENGAAKWGEGFWGEGFHQSFSSFASQLCITMDSLTIIDHDWAGKVQNAG